MKMKYFADRIHFGKPNLSLVNEITPKTAMEFYKLNAGPGFLNLSAIPNYHDGAKVRLAHCWVWGEIITDAECFKRMLAGKLENDFWDGQDG